MHLRLFQSDNFNGGGDNLGLQRRESASPRQGRLQREAQTIRETVASQRVESQTNLTVQTAEGDRITISLAAQSEITSASHQDSGGTTAALTASSNTKVNISVRGDLSPAELADLGKLIGALRKATSEAQQTGGVDTTSLTGTLSGLNSLAAFKYSQSQTVETGVLVRVAA